MKNKKILTALVVFLTLSSTFIGCKKGENDPLISLRSRDARIEGDWELSEMTSKSTTTTTSTFNPTPNVSSTNTTYSNGEFTTDGSTIKTKLNYTIKLEKNGQLTITSESFDSKGASNGIDEEKGYWTWGSTAKKKSSILITVKDLQGLALNGVWNIDQLKNKEIIFKKVMYSKNASPNSTSTTEGEISITFKAK